MNLNKIVLKCKFITPAFIYGANNCLELRTSSIKGLMRFWWRATYTNWKYIDTLRNKEAEIFGGKYIAKDSNEIFTKAKVQMSCKTLLNNTYTEINNKLFEKNPQAFNYLFYSMNLKGNKDKLHFKENKEFEVTFKFLDKNLDYAKEYLKAFNLLQLFGGLGGRNRRCGGNFVATSIDEFSGLSKDDITKLLYVEDSNTKIMDYYTQILNTFQDSNKNTDYSNIVDKTSEIYLYGFNNNEKNILEDESNPFAKLKQLEFYKPFNFIEKMDVIGTAYKKLRNETYKKNSKRGTCPLILKVVKDINQCKILLIKLAGPFAPEEIDITDTLIENLKKDTNITFRKLK